MTPAPMTRKVLDMTTTHCPDPPNDDSSTYDQTVHVTPDTGIDIDAHTPEGDIVHWEVATTRDGGLCIRLRDWSRRDGQYPKINLLTVAVVPASASEVVVKRAAT